jgi:hypothetical protein
MPRRFPDSPPQYDGYYRHLRRQHAHGFGQDARHSACQKWWPTRTHALVASSPALNAVTDAPFPPPPIDQRGITRPQDGNGDRGVAAYDSASLEFVAAAGSPGTLRTPAPPPPASTLPDQAITEPTPPASTPTSPDHDQTDDTGDGDNPAGTQGTRIRISEPVSGDQLIQPTAWGMPPF